MSETLMTAAGELCRAGELVDRVLDELVGLDLALPAGPGRLGEVGLELGRQWADAIGARRGEARTGGAELAALAGDLRRAAAGYTETDHGARRRHEGTQS